MGKRSKKPTSPVRAPTMPPQRPPRLCCIRTFLFFLFLALVGVSLYFSYTTTNLLHNIQSLQDTIASQQSTIQRFNTSVTNADVTKKVQELEESLHSTEDRMTSELQHTQEDISTLLATTVAKLNETVTAAQDQIHTEVGIVKKNVDQYVRTTEDQFSMENHFMVFQLAGTFTLLASLISMWHMTAHLRKFERPHVQRKVLAILWMSPIYGVTSWLSLIFPSYEGYLAIIKDFYEAYVIYQFLSFLIAVLGRGDRDTVVDVLAKHADHLEPPIRFCGWCRGKYPFLSPKKLADAVLMQCQVFAMQFVFFKPLTATSMFICNKLDYYGAGTSANDYRSPQFWINVVQNISVFLAFSGLLKFYHAVHEDLEWCRPFPKFLCIKGIVFMTFWQGLTISILAATTDIEGDTDDSDKWGRQAQNFLICLEMLLFSIAHFYCFPTDEWQEGYQPESEKKTKFGDNLALNDFVADLKLIMKGTPRSKSGRKIKGQQSLSGKTAYGALSASVESMETVEEAENRTEDIEKDIDEGGEEKKIADGDNKELRVDEELGEDISEDSSDHISEDISEDSSEGDNDEKLGEDETDAVSSTADDVNSSFDADDVVETIRTSLDNADQDVREAATRLLNSAMIQNMSERDDNADDDDNENDDENADDNEDDNDGEEPDETTNLLGGSSRPNSNEDLLRPSIFTKVGDMDMGAMNKFT